jgi:hypothetical protein
LIKSSSFLIRGLHCAGKLADGRLSTF